MSSSAIAFATETTLNIPDKVTEASEEIAPRINWSATVQLENAWKDITKSNNTFPDRPTVTNHANSPATINIRILKENGEQIGAMKTIEPGKSAKLDTIPAFSGKYTVQASGAVDGSYTITIN